jgi:peptidyl-prolyl cis-trans isomerase C/foldase protein PrsA
VGWVEKGQLDESMDKAIFSLTQGNYSDVTKTPYGYHIFRVLEERPKGIKELPEVIEEIDAKLFHKKRDTFYKEWVKELRNNFSVKINKALLDKLELK